MDQEVNGDDVGSWKYLTFFLGEEEYGIETLKVQEIIGIGVINLKRQSHLHYGRSKGYSAGFGEKV